MKGFDYCWLGYPLPFYDYCIDSKDKSLLHFRLFGLSGTLQDYVLRKNGCLYKKENPYVSLDITGVYVLENPLIEYTLRYNKGKLEKIHYNIKVNPTFFNISRTKSRYMLQSQILDDITDECVRLSQNTLRELLLLQSPHNPYYLEILAEMANVNFKDYGELPHARNITLYDLVLLAKAVGGKLNILIDDLRGKSQNSHIKLDSLIERFFLERREREKLRSHFVWSMRKTEKFLQQVDTLKNAENFIIDPRMAKAIRTLQGDIEQHTTAYRLAQKRLPVS